MLGTHVCLEQYAADLHMPTCSCQVQRCSAGDGRHKGILHRTCVARTHLRTVLQQHLHVNRLHQVMPALWSSRMWLTLRVMMRRYWNATLRQAGSRPAPVLTLSTDVANAMSAQDACTIMCHQSSWHMRLYRTIQRSCAHQRTRVIAAAASPAPLMPAWPNTHSAALCSLMHCVLPSALHHP